MKRNVDKFWQYYKFNLMTTNNDNNNNNLPDYDHLYNISMINNTACTGAFTVVWNPALLSNSPNMKFI